MSGLYFLHIRTAEKESAIKGYVSTLWVLPDKAELWLKKGEGRED